MYIHVQSVLLIVIPEIMVLCDYCNLALYKPTTANCYDTSHPCHAVDGDHNQTFVSCKSNHPWWQVDMGMSRKVDSIKISFLPGEPTDDISTTTFEDISPGGDILNITKCGVDSKILSLTLCKESFKGRYIRISKKVLSGTIKIQEVEVYGDVDGPCPEITEKWICDSMCVAPEGATGEQVCSRCKCPCTTLGEEVNHILTEEELQQKIDKLLNEISIDKKNTAVSKRKLISAPDSRKSAVAVGSTGIVILALLLLGIIAMDASRLVCLVHLTRRFCNKYKN
ncbi:uncharacterized protein [Mytilus edulis]|uniref:uncharacterized protein isoform X1 n=1 Tax=Mytilus edulis TaxID=6550 RepID=UPI0039F0E317